MNDINGKRDDCESASVGGDSDLPGDGNSRLPISSCKRNINSHQIRLMDFESIMCTIGRNWNVSFSQAPKTTFLQALQQLSYRHDEIPSTQEQNHRLANLRSSAETREVPPQMLLQNDRSSTPFVTDKPLYRHLPFYEEPEKKRKKYTAMITRSLFRSSQHNRTTILHDRAERRLCNCCRSIPP